jgi:hypothetical protein
MASWSKRNRRLIDYNPQGRGTEGEVLLFGSLSRRPPSTARMDARLPFACDLIQRSIEAPLTTANGEPNALAREAPTIVV